MAIHHLNCGTLCPYGGKLVTGEGGLRRGRDVLSLPADRGRRRARARRHRLRRRRRRPPAPAARRAVHGRRSGRRRELGETALRADPRPRPRPRRRPPHRGHPSRPRPRRRAAGLPRRRGARVRAGARPPPCTRTSATEPATRPAHVATARAGSSTPSTAIAGSASRACACSRASTPRSLLIPLLGHSRGPQRDRGPRRRRLGAALRRRLLLPRRGRDARRAARPGCARSRRRWPPTTPRAVPNQERLRELARDHGDEVRMFCSHDPVELEREQAR